MLLAWLIGFSVGTTCHAAMPSVPACSLTAGKSSADLLAILLCVSAGGEGPAALFEILKSINERTCKKKCAVGSGGKSVG